MVFPNKNYIFWGRSNARPQKTANCIFVVVSPSLTIYKTLTIGKDGLRNVSYTKAKLETGLQDPVATALDLTDWQQQ